MGEANSLLSSMVSGRLRFSRLVSSEPTTRFSMKLFLFVYYQYPTKGVGETVLRFDGQQEVIFSLGWENVGFIPILVTGFVIRLFYYGSDSVPVDVVIKKVVNPVTFTGLGFMCWKLVSYLVMGALDWIIYQK